ALGLGRRLQLLGQARELRLEAVGLLLALALLLGLVGRAAGLGRALLAGDEVEAVVGALGPVDLLREIEAQAVIGAGGDGAVVGVADGGGDVRGLALGGGAAHGA